MIRSTFTILDGIGSITERKLWASGIITWEDFLSKRKISGISPLRKETFDRELLIASRELEKKNSKYFLNKLKRGEHWRLFDSLKEDTVYLDIETTGLAPPCDEVTVVGLYNEKEMKTLIKGIDLTEERLQEELSQYKMIVTYYGSVFDLPFLSSKFSHLDLELPHFDLCFSGRRVGLKGSLKTVERQVGLIRDPEIAHLDGFDAVRLWYAYKSGDKSALDLLLRYNIADTKNLARLARIIYEKLRESMGVKIYTFGLTS